MNEWNLEYEFRHDQIGEEVGEVSRPKKVSVLLLIKASIIYTKKHWHQDVRDIRELNV